MASPIVAILDTSVLLRAGLMRFLTGIAATGAYLPRWSAAILNEWEARLGQRPEVLHEALRACLDVVPDASLPVTDMDMQQAVGNCDPDDEHVLAAALCARRLAAEDPDRWGPDCQVVLVTGNLQHFPQESVGRLGVRALDPDGFGALLLAERPAAVLRTVDREPPHRYEAYLQRMRDDGLLETADTIEASFAKLDLPG